MARGFFSSTRFRLFVLVFLTILPVTALLYHNALEQRRQAAAEMEKNALRLAQLIALNEQQELAQARELLANLARSPEAKQPGTGECASIFFQGMVYSSRYLNFTMVRPDGEVICSAHPLPDTVNFAVRSWFPANSGNRGFAMSEFVMDRITLMPTVVLAFR